MPLSAALRAAVVFLSAFLLFLVEPMAARRLLPVLGGSAAVWTTALVFYQASLFGGYLYAHLIAKHIPPRRQAIAHWLLLTAAAVALTFGARAPADWTIWHPALMVMWLLTAGIGLPFVALASTSPLVQSWVAQGRLGEARAPWRLFALSNAGSLLALVTYPSVVETQLSLRAQTRLWNAGFLLFAILCGLLAWQSTKRLPAIAENHSPPPKPSPARRALWVALPMCGSMMLSAITSHLSSNVAAIPLLWVVPLIAYLLSFIVAFSGERAYPRFVMIRLFALALGVLAYLIENAKLSLSVPLAVPVYTAALFVLCFFCHGELYRLRPELPGGDAATRFYLFVSAGSALGATAVGLLAPLVFRADYDLAAGLIVTAAVAIAVLWEKGVLTRLLWCGVTAAMGWVLFLQVSAVNRDALVELRGFYGSLRVTETHLPPEAGVTRELYHGTIEHGAQLYGNGLRMKPTTYYAEDSGVGLAMRLCCIGRTKNVGVVGLGAGTMAAYGQPGDRFTFYEIDPLVLRLARSLFTYLRESPATVDVVLGDARLSLEHAPPQSYDVLVLDAFSGDAVPVHLLTSEAMTLYRSRLRPDGVLAYHVSSQYLDLAPVIAAEAEAAGLHSALIKSTAVEAEGEFDANWVLVTARPGFVEQPEIYNVSVPIETYPGVTAWSDERNSLLPLFKWRSPSEALRQAW